MFNSDASSSRGYSRTIAGTPSPALWKFGPRPCHSVPMKRDEAIACLKQHEPELKQLGVERLFLFGSVVRNEAREDSDVDLFFDTQKGRLDLFDLMDIKERADAILGRRAGIMTRDSIHRMPRCASRSPLCPCSDAHCLLAPQRHHRGEQTRAQPAGQFPRDPKLKAADTAQWRKLLICLVTHLFTKQNLYRSPAVHRRSRRKPRAVKRSGTERGLRAAAQISVAFANRAGLAGATIQNLQFDRQDWTCAPPDWP